jgi:hypothetical protein
MRQRFIANKDLSGFFLYDYQILRNRSSRSNLIANGLFLPNEYFQTRSRTFFNLYFLQVDLRFHHPGLSIYKKNKETIWRYSKQNAKRYEQFSKRSKERPATIPGTREGGLY